MADPVTMLAIGSAVATGAGTIYSSKVTADSMEAQAEADQKRAAMNAQWAERRAVEERAAAQSAAGNELRTARIAQSRLGAVAGASGGGASDPTVMKLWEGIQAEGDQNAARVQAAGDQKATGMGYQAALDRWSADGNAAIKRTGARGTLIGGMLTGLGQMGTGMSARYGSRRPEAASTGVRDW